MSQAVAIERDIPDVCDTRSLPAEVAAEVDFLGGRSCRWLHGDDSMVRARALAASGDGAGAARLVDETPFEGLGPQELMAAAYAVSRAGSLAAAGRLLPVLGRLPEFVTTGTASEIPLGPRALAEGMVAATLGDLDRADSTLRDAIAVGERRAPLWGALARLELVRVLACSAVVDGDGADYGSVERAAALFFRAGGYQHLAHRLAAVAGDAPDRGPRTGRLLAGPRWTVGLGVMADVEMRDGKGLVALRYLVDHPDRGVPAIVLDAVVDGRDPTALVVDPSTVADETVRSRIGKLLRRTVARIEEVHPLLGRHLDRSLSGGRLWTYETSRPSAVDWRT